jgi:hypothetical protein
MIGMMRICKDVEMLGLFHTEKSSSLVDYKLIGAYFEEVNLQRNVFLAKQAIL